MLMAKNNRGEQNENAFKVNHAEDGEGGTIQLVYTIDTHTNLEVHVMISKKARTTVSNSQLGRSKKMEILDFEMG